MSSQNQMSESESESDVRIRIRCQNATLSDSESESDSFLNKNELLEVEYGLYLCESLLKSRKWKIVNYTFSIFN
jgi:hypothetical protein